MPVRPGPCGRRRLREDAAGGHLHGPHGCHHLPRPVRPHPHTSTSTSPSTSPSTCHCRGCLPCDGWQSSQSIPLRCITVGYTLASIDTYRSGLLLLTAARVTAGGVCRAMGGKAVSLFLTVQSLVVLALIVVGRSVRLCSHPSRRVCSVLTRLLVSFFPSTSPPHLLHHGRAGTPPTSISSSPATAASAAPCGCGTAASTAQPASSARTPPRPPSHRSPTARLASDVHARPPTLRRYWRASRGMG